MANELNKEALLNGVNLAEIQRDAFRRELQAKYGYTDERLRELVATEQSYDYLHDWQLSQKFENAYTCPACGEWTSNLPKYKYYICPAKDRRKTDRRCSNAKL